jgi:hypothetical protein
VHNVGDACACSCLLRPCQVAFMPHL